MQEKNRVAETATTTGTALITLAGAILGHQTFATAYGSSGNAEVPYGILHDSDGTWEVGIGTYIGVTNQLQRDLPLDGTSGSSRVNFAAGAKTVYVPRVAEAAIVARSRRATDVAMEIRAASGQSANLLAAHNAAGGLAFSVNAAGGAAFASRLADSATDLSKHIDLWGGTYGFGITSGTLNVVSGGNTDFYSEGSLVARLGASLAIGTPTAGPAQNGVTVGANAITLQVANGLAGTGAMLTAMFGSTRQFFFRRDGIAEIGASGFRFNAKQDGTPQAGYLTCTVGAAGFVMQSGAAAGAIYQMRDSADAIVGRIEPDDGTAPQPQTIMTRRKGDVRYSTISAARFKPGAAAIDYVDVTQFVLKGWTWGGDLDSTHPRYGFPGSGFIAEELEDDLPSAVIYDADENVVGLDALTLVAHLAAHVATLEARITALE